MHRQLYVRYSCVMHNFEGQVLPSNAEFGSALNIETLVAAAERKETHLEVL